MADKQLADKQSKEGKSSKWKWIAVGAVVIVGVIAAAFAFLDPFDTQFDDVEAAQMYTATEPKAAPTELDHQAVDQLLVMNWNAKFAGGRIDFFFDCHGDRVIMEESEVLEHLEGLAKKINQVDPDVLLLQEIDIDSKRAAYVDQVQWLLDHTNLNYGAYASQWRASYIPKHGLGKVNSGNAVLSKWPIENAERLALPLIEEQDAITQYFYLKRNILRAKVVVPGKKPLWVANIHTAAFAQDGTKSRQIEEFERELAKLDEQGKTFVAGGDLNTVPPGADKLKDFPDSVCEGEDFQADDYTADIGVLDGLYERYQPAIPLEKFADNNDRYQTHTTDKDGFWNRKLDYLFTNGEFVDGWGMVHQDTSTGGMETMPLSDHAPVTAVLEWQ
jgi:endonuclease/exonuclease/phosphatase family metal-dependent hydrolase